MNSQYHTALHSAAKAGDLEVAEILLREQIDVYRKDEQGFTPLHILIQKRIEMFESLHTKRQKEIVDHKVAPKDSKIDMHSAICQEISKNEKFVRMLLEQESSSFNCKPEVQLLNFHAACTLNDSSMAEKLLEQLDVNQPVDASSPIYPGYTALHFAAHCSVNTVKMLVSKAANLLVQDSKAVTPLQICMKSFSLGDVHSILTELSEWRYALFSDGKTKLVDYIFSLCNADSHKNFLQAMDEGVRVTVSKDSPLWPEYTILHVALTLLPESDVKMIEDILNINPDLITMQDTYGSTAVHLAFRQNKLEIVRLLLEHQKTVKNPLDDDNLSYLHIAAAIDNQKITRAMLNQEEALNVAYKGEPLPMVKLGWTPLHVAVHAKHAIIARTLLEGGANFLQPDARGFNAVHLLLGSNNMKEIAEFVFTSDQLEERVVNNVGLTHLHVAAWLDEAEAIEQLLDLGSDIEATIGKLEYEHLKKFEGCRPIHLTIIGRMETDAFATLLKRGANVLSRRFDEPTPLAQVLTGESNQSYVEPIIKLLRNNKKLQQRLEKETGMTKLHILCCAFDEKNIQQLLKEGVNVNARVRNNSSYWPGFTPLQVFIWNYNGGRYENLCRMLLSKGANVHLTDAEGNTPVLLLLKSWNFASVHEFARYLLKHQHDFSVNHTNKSGLSHFHVACLLHEVEIAKEFLKHPIDVNQQIHSDKETGVGKTPLHLALFLHVANYPSANRQIDTVNLLLERGADVAIVDAKGRTVLHDLVNCSLTRIVLLDKLLGAGINKRANDGKTAMEILLSSSARSYEIFYFLKRGAKINSDNPISDEGYMAILLKNYRETKPDYRNILEIMMDSSDIVELSDTGRNAIHNTVSVKYTYDPSYCPSYSEIIEKLTKLGCDILQQDCQGRTPLHLAVKFEDVKAVEALMDWGADVNIIDISGKSPFAYAFELHENDKLWNLTSDPGWRSAHVGETLAKYLMQLQVVGLQMSELNAKLLTKVQSKSDEKKTEDALEVYSSDFKGVQKTEMSKGGLTILSFLHPTLLVNSYSLLNQKDRDDIDLFFEKNKWREYKWVSRFLRLQYNNVQQRPSLIGPAVHGLRLLMEFPLPDVCADIILTKLTNLDLKNMIAASKIILQKPEQLKK